MPSYKAGNGEYKDICFPCTKESKAEFDKAAIGAYQQTLTKDRPPHRNRNLPNSSSKVSLSRRDVGGSQ